MGGVLAIDLGAEKSGFAWVDAARICCVPLDVVRAAEGSDELLAHIASLLEEHDFDTLLAGLPLHADGAESERATATRAFLARVGERFPQLSLHTHDEHGTTKEAEARLREAGYTGREAKARRDSWSALVILEDWLSAGEP